MMTVEAIRDRRALLGLEAEWNDAVDRAAVRHPFLRHEWMRTWFDCFGGGARLQVLVARANGRIQAIAPLMFETGTMYGVPIRRLRLMHNDQTPRADFIVCSQRDESLRALWLAILDLRDQWDVLQLGQLPRRSATRAILTEYAAAAGCATGVWRSGASPYLALDGTWDAYQRRLSPKFRSNVRNRLTRLTQLGEPRLETVTDPDDVEAACDDVVRIEAAAWKHDEGTAIASDPAVDRLYRTYAAEAARRGYLRIFFLTVDGRRIAASYSLEYRRRLFLFKTGYDPAFAKCSPFKLLTHVILRGAYASNLAEVDFLGDPEPWKLEWTPTTRPHDWLYIFSNSVRARLLHPLKFHVVPAIKRYRMAESLAG